MVDKAHVYIVDSVSMTAIAKPSRSQSYPQPKQRQDINLHALNETSRFFLTENPSSHRPTRPNHEQVSALGMIFPRLIAIGVAGQKVHSTLIEQSAVVEGPAKPSMISEPKV